MAESEYIMTKLNINFLKESISEEMKNEFFTAVKHEETSMLISQCKDNIEKLEKSLKKDDITEEEVKALTVKLEAEKSVLETLKESSKETLETFNKVVSALTEKNKDHFGNKHEVVRNVLRILATWDNSGLIKYALVETFKGEALHNALEAIHVNSKANEDGATIMSKDVKEAYKKGSQELESIVKTTFSLPFETAYTEKTRVKMTAEDKKLLNDCYVRGFKDKYTKNEASGLVDYSGRQVNTLVRGKKDKKTGIITYNYSGLFQTVSQIVMKHYFK